MLMQKCNKCGKVSADTKNVITEKRPVQYLTGYFAGDDWITKMISHGQEIAKTEMLCPDCMPESAKVLPMQRTVKNIRTKVDFQTPIVTE